MIYPSNGIIEKDSRRKKYRSFKSGNKIAYGIELRHIIFILAVIGFLVFINLNFDKITNYFQPKNEEIQEPETIVEKEIETIKVFSKKLLMPVKTLTCEEIYFKENKKQVIQSLCSSLCEESMGEFEGESRCMGDKKLYCRCVLYEYIQKVNEKEETSIIEEPSIEEPSELKNIMTAIKDEFKIDPERKEECMAAFEYVNELRKQNDRNLITWDDRVYDLAVFRTKDMYERKYFDHVTPEGKCVKDFQGDYGLSQYSIAENAGAQAWNLDNKNMNYDTTVDVRAQVNGWMESRGHRYNLLYPDHIIGAIGCYYGACVFLGVNQNPYGLGAGPCTTGEEGLAFWEASPEQPGEV